MNEETALRIEAQETEATVTSNPEAALKGIISALAKMSSEERSEFLLKQFQLLSAGMSTEERSKFLAALQGK